MAQGSIVVEFKADYGEGGNTAINDQTGETKSPQKVQKDNSEAQKKAEMAFYTTSLQSLVNLAVNTTKSEALYWINRSFNLRDDVEGARDMNIALNVASKVWGIGQATVSGAMAGAVFGPVGAAVGAGLGFTMSSIGTVTSTLHGYVEEDTNLKLDRHNH